MNHNHNHFKKTLIDVILFLKGRVGHEIAKNDNKKANVFKKYCLQFFMTDPSFQKKNNIY